MMDNIVLEATDRTCAVEFDFAAGRFRVAGESYPEDAAAFFGPLHRALDQYLAGRTATELGFEIALVYFNSSSAKALMGLLERFDAAAARGNDVTITWVHDPEDDAMEDMAREFGEDISHARYIVRPTE